MTQEERSQRSRAKILKAALDLFSHRGYGATSMRDIAEKSGASIGSVYHHFTEKEEIFRTLLDEYWSASASADFPVNRALAQTAFPDNLEALGRASRDSVIQYRPYVALIYVDVVEFEGKHIRKFYADMAHRFQAFIDRQPNRQEIEARLRPGVSAAAAMMLASRIFLSYFAVEILFGVENHFGTDSDTALREVSDILLHGILRS